jgi:hypothetical protein
MIKTNSKIELLKNENSNLKKEIIMLSVISELNEWDDEFEFNSSVNTGLWLEISFVEKDEDGLIFYVHSTHDNFKFHTDFITIYYSDIINWFIRNNKEFSQENLSICIKELIGDTILTC